MILLLVLLSAGIAEKTWTIDGSEIKYAYEDDENIVFTGGNRTLGIGTYRVIFHYRTDGENNTYRFSSGFEDTSQIHYDRGIVFNPSKREQTATLTLTAPVSDFETSIYQKSSSDILIDEIEIIKDTRGYRVFAVCFFLLFLVSDLILLWYDRTKDKCIFAVVLIALLAGLPIYAGYLTGGHDLTFHLFRIEGIKEALLSGQFPVRIHPTPYNGYSTPTAMYYPELFLFVPALLRMAGVSVHTTFQILLMGIHLGTAVISYTSFKFISKNSKIAALVCAFYTLNFYRMEIVHYRYAIGEALGMMLIPLFLLAFMNLVRCTENTFKAHRKNIILLVLACTLIIQSHLLTCYLLVPMGIVLLCVYAKELIKNKTWIDIPVALALTLLLNAWFFLPLYEMTGLNYYMKSEKNYDIGENALLISQIFFTSGNMDGVTKEILNGVSGEMPLTIGLSASVVFVGLLLLAPIVFRKRDESPKEAKLYLVSMFLTIVSLWLCTNLFPWYLAREGGEFFTKLLGVMQFPWRFLTMVVFFESLALIGGLKFIEKEDYYKISCFLVALLSLITLFIVSEKLVTGDSPRRIYNEAVRYRKYITKDYLNINTDIYKIPPEEELLENTYIVSYRKEGSNVWMEVNNTSDFEQPINVSLFLFPGYVATDDSNETLLLQEGTDGLIAVMVPPHYHGNIKISVKEKPLWIVGDVISVVVLFGLLAAYIVPYFMEKNKNTGMNLQNSKSTNKNSNDKKPHNKKSKKITGFRERMTVSCILFASAFCLAGCGKEKEEASSEPQSVRTVVFDDGSAGNTVLPESEIVPEEKHTTIEGVRTLSIYRRNPETKVREKMTEFVSPWVRGTDISSFEVFATDTDSFSFQTAYFDDAFLSYWNTYDGNENCRIGYTVDFDLKNGEKIHKTLLKAGDELSYREYLENYLYDDVHQTKGAWYSHLLPEEMKDTTLMTSIKFTPGERIEEVGDTITCTAFVYNSDEDFDEDGDYIGDVSSTVVIKRE